MHEVHLPLMLIKNSTIKYNLGKKSDAMFCKWILMKTSQQTMRKHTSLAWLMPIVSAQERLKKKNWFKACLEWAVRSYLYKKMKFDIYWKKKSKNPWVWKDVSVGKGCCHQASLVRTAAFVCSELPAQVVSGSGSPQHQFSRGWDLWADSISWIYL